jgi:hypothetical protein
LVIFNQVVRPCAVLQLEQDESGSGDRVTLPGSRLTRRSALKVTLRS